MVVPQTPQVGERDVRRPVRGRSALVGVDARGQVAEWSAGAVELLGHSARSMVGMPLASIAVAPATAERVARMRREVLDGGVVEAENRWLQCADGRTIEVETEVFPLLDAVGGVARVTVLFTPVPCVESGPGAVADTERRIAGLAGAHRLREVEVRILRLLCEGHRVPTIARRLHCAPGTVRNKLSVLYAKVGVRTQIELVELLVGDRVACRVDGRAHRGGARAASR